MNNFCVRHTHIVYERQMATASEIPSLSIELYFSMKIVEIEVSHGESQQFIGLYPGVSPDEISSLLHFMSSLMKLKPEQNSKNLPFCLSQKKRSGTDRILAM